MSLSQNETGWRGLEGHQLVALDAEIRTLGPQNAGDVASALERQANRRVERPATEIPRPYLYQRTQGRTIEPGIPPASVSGQYRNMALPTT